MYYYCLWARFTTRQNQQPFDRLQIQQKLRLHFVEKKKEKKNKNLLLESYYKLLFGRILLATVGFEKRLLLRKKYFIITMLTYYYIWLDRATTMILSRRTPNDNYLSTTYTTTYLQHGTKNGFLSLILIHYHHCYWYQ